MRWQSCRKERILSNCSSSVDGSTTSGLVGTAMNITMPIDSFPFSSVFPAPFGTVYVMVSVLLKPPHPPVWSVRKSHSADQVSYLL